MSVNPRVSAFAILLVPAAVAALAAPALGADKPLVAEPHPLITEVLYAVPPGNNGDANADGVRDPVGDEFIELVNPHGRPINLKGYVLVDAEAYNPGAAKPDSGTPDASAPDASKPDAGKPDPAKPDAAKPDVVAPDAGKPGAGRPTRPRTKRAELRFTFPDLELKPGEVVVVFNGFKQKMSGPVGDALHAPSRPHERFHNAWVFSMNNEGPYVALGNDADMLVLLAPDGKPVSSVRWGRVEKNAPAGVLADEAPISAGSVQRDGPSGKLVPHKDLRGDLAGTLFSPGVFSMIPSGDQPAQRPDPNAGKPADASPAKPGRPNGRPSGRPDPKGQPAKP